MDINSPDKLELGTPPAAAATPIPFDDSGPGDEISHAPLSLGNSGPVVAPSPAATPVKKPEPPKQQTPVASSADRITGCKTFFTKLHAGAIDFLNGQITEWLAANPNIAIKLTNSVVGEVAAKNTEPNLIITVWY